MKGIQVRQEETKLSLFLDGTIVYIENPKEYTKNAKPQNLLANKWVQQSHIYKINTQEPIAFLYTNNEHMEAYI